MRPLTSDGYKGILKPYRRPGHGVLPAAQPPSWDAHIIRIEIDRPAVFPYLIEVALILVLAALAWAR